MIKRKYFTLNKLIVLLLGMTLLGIIYIYISMNVYKIVPNSNLKIIKHNIDNSNIILLTHNNENFDVKLEFSKNDWVIVYFGCLQSCDIFMNAMNKMNEIKQLLAKQNIKVLNLFVTLDPSRDKQILLNKVFNEYKNVTALTGTITEIKKMARLFAVNFIKSEKINETNYIIDHPRVINIMSKNLTLNKQFDLLSDNSEIMEFVQNHTRVKKQ